MTKLVQTKRDIEHNHWYQTRMSTLSTDTFKKENDNIHTIEPQEIEMTDLNSPSHTEIQPSIVKDKRDFEIRLDVKPLKIVHFIINHPCKIICTFLFLCIIMIIIDSMVFEFSPSSGREWLVNDSEEVHKYDSGFTAHADISDSSATPVDPRTQIRNWLTLVTIFKTRDGTNILTPDYLNFISEINNKIINTDNEQYKKVCFADAQSFPNCSTTAYVDPIISAINTAGYDVETITDTQISTVIASLITNYGDQIYVNFEESFATSNDRESQYYRAFFRFGLPYPDINETHSSFRNSEDRPTKQQDSYDEWIFPIWKDIHSESNNNENIEVVVSGGRMRDILFNMLAQESNKWALASVLIVWLIMFYHMKSLFLSSAAMIQIILGFPFSYFFYRIVCKITYFGALHSTIIFVILGIAADDCFVFVDAWIQSEQSIKNSSNILERMSYTYKRAGYAMFVTTFTTAIAFLATAFSTIIPIAAFGIWAALVVIINYLLMLTYFPACLSWYFQYFKKYEKCCCFNKNRENTLSFMTRSKSLDISNGNEDINYDDTDANMGKLRSMSTILPSLVGKKDGKIERIIETFLKDTYSKWILRFKYYILAFFMVIISISIWKASQLEGLSEQEKFFEDSHFMRKAFDYQHFFYGGNINTLTAPQLVWGIHPRMDRSGTDPWKADDVGKVQYDDEFDLSPTDTQQFIYDICQELLTQHTDKVFSPQTELDCFIYDMIDYANTTLGMSFPLSFSNDPINQTTQFTDFIATWIANDAQGKYWMNRGDVGYFEIENKLKYIKIRFKITVSRWGKFDTKKESFDFWESKMKEWNTNSSTPSTGYQGAFAWAWMASEKAFVSNAFQGVVIALPAAFMVLLLSTHNWIMSIFAIITIIGIILSAVMIMVLQGWQLGVIESVAIVIMIGFSIDYVIHFATAYIECPYSQKRTTRIKYSLYTMGISIIFGSITTIGAGFFLIFPALLFFKKFGILIMSVVVLSLIYAFGFFMSILAVFGPIGNRGHIPFTKFMQICKK